MPQSPFSKNNDCMPLRNLHPSYFNRISLLSTSLGNPGESFTLCPYLKMYKNLHFTEGDDSNNVDITSMYLEEDDN